MSTQEQIGPADALERYRTVHLPSRNLASMTGRGCLIEIADPVASR